MKSPFLFILGIFAGLAAPRAVADSFSFSYTFATSTTQVTGTFTGDENGLFVENIADFSLAINGTPFALTYFATAYSDDGWLGLPVVSYDAAYNNFLFADADIAGGDFGYSVLFYMVNDVFGLGIVAQSPDGLDSEGSEEPSTWKLTNLSKPVSVADGGTTAMMFLLTLAGLGLLRRQTAA